MSYQVNGCLTLMLLKKPQTKKRTLDLTNLHHGFNENGDTRCSLWTEDLKKSIISRKKSIISRNMTIRRIKKGCFRFKEWGQGGQRTKVFIRLGQEGRARI